MNKDNAWISSLHTYSLRLLPFLILKWHPLAFVKLSINAHISGRSSSPTLISMQHFFPRRRAFCWPPPFILYKICMDNLSLWMMLELFFRVGYNQSRFFFLTTPHHQTLRLKFLREVRQMLQIVVVENHPLTRFWPPSLEIRATHQEFRGEL